jgi:hypothetical protein
MSTQHNGGRAGTAATSAGFSSGMGNFNFQIGSSHQPEYSSLKRRAAVNGGTALGQSLQNPFSSL